MDHSQSFSLTQLAAVTGSGKAALRAMIEAGTLAATRAEAGRKEWVIRLDDALAADLQVPADAGVRGGTGTLRSGGADGIDAAMGDLFAELLGPIEQRLASIDAQNQRITALLGDLTDNQRPSMQRCQKFKTVGRQLWKLLQRVLS
jgi:hypothetical protein